MLCLAKGVLSSILPSHPGMALTSPPEVTVTKGRYKADSTKRDKYRSQADLVWDLVRVYVGETDSHGPLGVEVEGVVVNEVVYHYHAPHKWEINAHCHLYTCNGNIIVMIKSMTGQILIYIGLQIRTRDMLGYIQREIPFTLTFSCYCN
ncbi:hypothetical protein M9H77_01800 [Catharanthus roseus]|uniref:Uncharacterized protein n=1 Tax=Catharanthus roseus TaxID=4058 RepID=A0ACC0C6I5_CATRO|nr:hypothetical protein M9H77_01800 [Catharanthus roseus]